MPYEPVRRTGAGRWSVVLGLALALLAAGSFIAFSLVARDATAGLDDAIAALPPATNSTPVISFAAPDRVGAGDGPDGVRRSNNGRDLVLGTRFFNGSTNGPSRISTSGSGTSTCGTCGGTTKTRHSAPDPNMTPARPEEPSYDGRGNKKVASPPYGNAYGHDKNGKAYGHGKGKG